MGRRANQLIGSSTLGDSRAVVGGSLLLNVHGVTGSALQVAQQALPRSRNRNATNSHVDAARSAGGGRVATASAASWGAARAASDEGLTSSEDTKTLLLWPPGSSPTIGTDAVLSWPSSSSAAGWAVQLCRQKRDFCWRSTHSALARGCVWVCVGGAWTSGYKQCKDKGPSRSVRSSFTFFHVLCLVLCAAPVAVHCL